MGFKEPCNIDLSPELTPPPQHIHHKERVTEFAAEIGRLYLSMYSYTKVFWNNLSYIPPFTVLHKI